MALPRRKKRVEELARREAENPDLPNPAPDAATAAGAVLGDGQPLLEERVEGAQEDFEAAVEEQVEEIGKPRDEVEEETESDVKR